MKDKMDGLLKKALLPTLEPDTSLNQEICNYQNTRRKTNMSKLKKLPAAAAIAVCVLCAGSVTVFAGNHFLKNMHAFQFGVSTNDNQDAVSEEESEFDATAMKEQPEDKIEDISVESGTAGTAWLSKKVQKVTQHVQTSDDRVNWEDYAYDVIYTTYEYADYNTAVKDKGMDNWLSESYQNIGNVQYVESVAESEDSNEHSTGGTFMYGSGTFELSESVTMDMEGNPLEIDSYTVITNETFNERTYTNKKGYTFTLADDETDGNKKTTVAITYGNYSGTLTFHGMTEEEIYHVLDTLQLK